jgi:hypothetical protein
MRRDLSWTCLALGFLWCILFPTGYLSALTDITDQETSNEQVADLEPALDELLPGHSAPARIPGHRGRKTSKIYTPSPLCLPLGRTSPGGLRREALRARRFRPLIFPRSSYHTAAPSLAGCDPLRPL